MTKRFTRQQQLRRNYICNIMFLFCIVLFPFDGVTSSELYDNNDNYTSAVKQLTVTLADKIGTSTKKYYQGQLPLIVNIIPDGLNNDFRWNSFVDRIINELQNQLNIRGFQANNTLQSRIQTDACSKKQSDSSENEHGSDITAYLTITPYHHQKQIRITVALKSTNPSSSFAPSFQTQVTDLLDKKYYKTAYREMQESFIPSGYPKGSKINPFEDERVAAQLMATIFLCKLEKATPAWNKSRNNAEKVDFQKLHYRFAGLKPGNGVSQETADQIGQAIYRQFSRHGLSINANADDLGKVLDHVEMYADLPQVYLDSEHAGEIQLVPSEAIILGDVIRDGNSSSRLLVSIRSVITSQRIGDNASQGFIIPSLSTYSYITDKETFQASIDTIRLFYDENGADALPESSSAVTAILKELKSGLQKKGFVFQKSMGQLTENNVVMNVTVELGASENVTNKFCVSSLSLNTVIVSATEQQQLASAQASREIVVKCGREISMAILRREGGKVVPSIVEEIWGQLPQI